jgi:hypothetical protein
VTVAIVVFICISQFLYAHPTLPGQTPWLLTIFENMRQIPGGGDKKYVKMPRSAAKNQ